MSDAAALMARLQMIGASSGGGGGGGAGGGIMCAGTKIPLLGALEQYPNSILAGLQEYMSWMDNILPGAGKGFAHLPTMNPNSLLARIVAEVFADICQSLSDAGIDPFANASIPQELLEMLRSAEVRSSGSVEIYGDLSKSGNESLPMNLQRNGEIVP